MTVSSSTLGLAPPPVDTYPYDLGSFGLRVSTTSADCQTWFNRGLTWSYGFHHEEAGRCFRYAITCDPGCAMAYWGLAYALGPNYNKEWTLFDSEGLKKSLEVCHEASAKAQKLATDPLEAALATAIVARYPFDSSNNFKVWNRAYADAMAEVYSEFSDDLNVAALYADALMDIAPWRLWDLQTGAPCEESQTLVIKEVLDKALMVPASSKHPGILHFYIHLMELSLTPEEAVIPGDHLRNLIPDAGHLNHMPGHLDLLIGDYRRCIDINLQSIESDEKYMKLGSSMDFYTFYRLHNYTFPIYAAMFNGQYQIAIETVERMEKGLTDELFRVPSPPLIDWLEGFNTFKPHVLVRFGKWDEILALPFPEDSAFYCVTTSVLHYARGVAYAVMGDVPNAEAERELFRESRKKIVPSRHAFPNSWKDVLDVGETMLNGELEYRKGNYELAFESLRESIKLNDNLTYAEPWGWMQPPRHAYAALQLEQGNVEEAAKTYAEDLGFLDSLPRACQHPNNVWALHGYHECLVKLGRTAEANLLKPQLTLALAVADIKVEASCFCRRADGIQEKQQEKQQTCCK
jgi:tetratricopeptide (TPR) repeat protein